MRTGINCYWPQRTTELSEDPEFFLCVTLFLSGPL